MRNDEAELDRQINFIADRAAEKPEQLADITAVAEMLAKTFDWPIADVRKKVEMSWKHRNLKWADLGNLKEGD